MCTYAAFTDLRRLVDDGQLAYPYSTRELVNIARHLQARDSRFSVESARALGTEKEWAYQRGRTVPGGAQGWRRGST
jgi:hypothetical protein